MNGKKYPDTFLEKSFMSVRPLTSSALKSIQDTLRPYIEGARVCDLFSGQARFSLKMLELGASCVVCVEKDKRLCLSYPKVDNLISVCTDVFSYLKKTSEQFDIIFADPPFPLWTSDFSALFLPLVKSVVKEEGIFLVRFPKKVILSQHLPKEFILWKEKRYGEAFIQYFRKSKT